MLVRSPEVRRERAPPAPCHHGRRDRGGRVVPDRLARHQRPPQRRDRDARARARRDAAARVPPQHRRAVAQDPALGRVRCRVVGLAPVRADAHAARDRAGRAVQGPVRVARDRRPAAQGRGRRGDRAPARPGCRRDRRRRVARPGGGRGARGARRRAGGRRGARGARAHARGRDRPGGGGEGRDAAPAGPRSPRRAAPGGARAVGRRARPRRGVPRDHGGGRARAAHPVGRRLERRGRVPRGARARGPCATPAHDAADGGVRRERPARAGHDPRAGRRSRPPCPSSRRSSSRSSPWTWCTRGWATTR